MNSLSLSGLNNIADVSYLLDKMPCGIDQNANTFIHEEMKLYFIISCSVYVLNRKQQCGDINKGVIMTSISSSKQVTNLSMQVYV